MSKGPGKIQRGILDVLGGKTMVYQAGSGFDTSELLEELEEAGIVDPERPRKERMGSVFRACRGLVDRKLIKGRYTFDANNPGRETVAWSLPEPGAPHPVGPGPSRRLAGR